MKKYFDENPIAEFKSVLAEMKKNDRKPLYFAIGVLALVALGLGALVYFIIKNKNDEECFDDDDWDDYEDWDECDDDCDCNCGCDCGCEDEEE